MNNPKIATNDIDSKTSMAIALLDMEGVLFPEIWIATAKRLNISDLFATTRDIPDYDELMQIRLDILAKHKITLADIHGVIDEMNPIDGALQFLRRIRRSLPVIILSDTFSQFLPPILPKLEWPTILCNSITVDSNGIINGYSMRQENGKRQATMGFIAMGCYTIAAGDSYNDLGMIQAANRGAFFRAPQSITAQYPHIQAFTDFDELGDYILRAR